MRTILLNEGIHVWMTAQYQPHENLIFSGIGRLISLSLPTPDGFSFQLQFSISIEDRLLPKDTVIFKLEFSILWLMY